MQINHKIDVGLRVDVDTYRGTRHGIPRLLDILNRHQINASFFFSVGPDNMGRHLWRLFHPSFLHKMFRSNAGSLYGYDILLKGTIWPGPNIAEKLSHLIRQTYHAGHEIGLHAWDHHKWQTQVERMSPEQLYHEIDLAYQALAKIIGHGPRCSAVAGWRCTRATLTEKSKFPFHYNSDCRGKSIFVPETGQAPQIPVTLPTYDELIGRRGITKENYNQTILEQIRPNQLNVYTIHAESEGIACAALFERFLTEAEAHNIRFVPLGKLLPQDIATLPVDQIYNKEMNGRQGWLSYQASTV
jgi:undecaprenyl phosphate-alpha-L-ara4FN deformylase